VSGDRTPLGPLPDPDDEASTDDLGPTARRLREALAAREAAVRPTDRLEEIRMASRTARRRSLARTVVAAAGVAAVVVVGGGAYALTQHGSDSVRTVAGSPSSTSSPSSASTTTGPAAPAVGGATPAATSAASSAATSAPVPATGTGTAPASSPATGTALPSGASSVPVYWLGGRPAKLYREYLPSAAAQNDPTAALRLMLAGEPTDPDYVSPWSPDEDAEVTLSGGRLVVDLAASAGAGDAGAGGADLALQQLVHTVTAAAGDDLPVEVRVDGKARPTLFGVPVAETLSRAPQADVQAPAWITEVTPSAGSVTVTGIGTAFEGTLLHTLTDAAGTEVERGSVQAGANGTFAEFSFTAAVPAGTYTVAVFAPDESDGEGPGPVGDTKTVTVP
jgi:hypothetical protein